MENKRVIVWASIAAVVAVVAYYLAISQAIQNERKKWGGEKILLVAIRDIPAGTRIDASMFRSQAFPETYISQAAATQDWQVVGQVAIATIGEGEPIYTNKLVPFDETSLDRRIPEGFRAVTIGIRDDQDVVGVGGNLRPGQFVDVLVTLFVNTKEIEKGPAAIAGLNMGADLKAETRTVFQNVRILAVGQDARLETAMVDRSNSGGPQNLTNKNVTVALRPDDVQKLILSQQVGRINLSLRRFNDTEILELDYLDAFKAFGIKLPVVAGPPPAYREIRGGQVIATPF